MAWERPWFGLAKAALPDAVGSTPGVTQRSQASCGKLAMAECRPAGPRLNVTAPGAAFSVDLAIADAIILR